MNQAVTVAPTTRKTMTSDRKPHCHCPVSLGRPRALDVTGAGRVTDVVRKPTAVSFSASRTSRTSRAAHIVSAVVFALPLLLLGTLLFGCKPGAQGSEKTDNAQARAQGKKAIVSFPVEAGPVRTRVVQYHIEAVGSVDAFEEVVITARVSGVVERVDFTEGDTVKAGARLVVIEPERYRIAVEAARAAVNRIDAEMSSARVALERRQEANSKSPGLIRNEDIDQARARLDVAIAQDSEAKAALKLAELNLRDAFVRAPVSGVIDKRIVTTGQYVQPGARLGTLVQRDPLLLRFEVSETEARHIATKLEVHFTVRGRSEAFVARVTHVAEVANATSRMVPVIAEITDSRRDALRPGSFAQVIAEVGSEREVPVIEESAVRPTENGFLVFVLDGDTAHARIVELGLRTTEGLLEVRSGLKKDEMIVIQGAEALRDGATVRIANSAAPSKASSLDGGAKP